MVLLRRPCWKVDLNARALRRKRFLPTTVAEVEAHRKARDLGAHSLSHEHSVLQKHPTRCLL
jgi:hypothetical protein